MVYYYIVFQILSLAYIPEINLTSSSQLFYMLLIWLSNILLRISAFMFRRYISLSFSVFMEYLSDFGIRVILAS